MAKLDVIAQAGEGQARSAGISGAVAQVSVTRASDGTAVTGLGSDAFDVWVGFSAQTGVGFRPGLKVIVEMSANGTGPNGFYQVLLNGYDEPGGPWNYAEQTVFVEIVVTDGGDSGQTVTSFYLPA